MVAPAALTQPPNETPSPASQQTALKQRDSRSRQIASTARDLKSAPANQRKAQCDPFFDRSRNSDHIFFICVHNETLSVVAMRVCNPEPCSRFFPIPEDFRELEPANLVKQDERTEECGA
jgi:hypothetical protein